MHPYPIENIRIDPAVGDGVAFTVDLDGVAHRFFISRNTLSEGERTLLASNHDMVASFERQKHKVARAVQKTLPLGTSANITFLHSDFFA